MKRVGQRHWMVLVVVLGTAASGAWWLVSTPVLGGPQVDTLSEGWRELPLQAFMDQARGTLLQQPPVAAEVAAAIREHAAQRLRTLSKQTPVAFDALLDLYDWGRNELTPAERDAVLAQLAPRAADAADVATWDLARLHRAHTQLTRLGGPLAMQEGLLGGWLEHRAVDETALAGLPNEAGVRAAEVAWLCGALDGRGTTADKFSVQWTGFLVAPAPGNYTFSTTPINVNFQSHGPQGHPHGEEAHGHPHGEEAHAEVAEHEGHVAQRLVVWIDGRQVLEAGGRTWSQVAEAVTCVAGQKLTLRVDFSYERTDAPYLRQRPAVVRLLWEGPGVSPRLVPASALSAGNGAAGLVAEYRYAVHGQPITVTQREPQLDQFWARDRAPTVQYVQQQRQALELFWSLASDAAYLAQCEAGGAPHVLLGTDAEGVSAGVARLLPAVHQAAWARLLVERPNLLSTAPPQVASRAYLYSRFAAPQEAVEAWGAWARRQPHPQPALVPYETFVETNWRDYHVLSDAVAVQYPPHRQWLEERCLEASEGSCSLPVAYVLGYAYAEEGRIEEWIAQLDERLADAALGGDARASWLQARAAAEEIRLVPPVSKRHGFPLEQHLLGGRSWLETAVLEAESETVRLAAYWELVARLAADDNTRDAARTLVDQAAKRLPQSQGELARWRQEIDGLGREAQRLRQQREEHAQRAYLDTLRQRHAQAVTRGDEQAAGRYQSLLRASGAEL